MPDNAEPGSFDMVPVYELKHGDYIILDDGSEIMVRGVEQGPNKSRCLLRLKGRPPIVVDGYWRPIARRLQKYRSPVVGGPR